MADSIEGASSPKLNQKFAVELGAWLTTRFSLLSKQHNKYEQDDNQSLTGNGPSTGFQDQ
jgi:hypothetical protein